MAYLIDCSPGALAALPAAISREALAALPAASAAALQVLPLRHRGTLLEVAMTPPLDGPRLQQLRLLSGCRVQARTLGEALLVEGLRRFYPEVASEASPEAAGAAALEAAPEKAGQEDGAEEGTAAVVARVDRIIAAAVERRASDIHLEPFEEALRLRYRIDGVLQAQAPPPARLAAALVSRIKVMANLDIAEKRRPQDGRMRRRVGEREIDLRVSTTPTAYGEKAVLRILDRTAVALELSALGFAPAVRGRLEQAVGRPYGLVLATGPTGSGKTTTLYAALNHIKSEGINILTVEDPVEYHLAGVNQTQVHAEIGLTFAHVLRSFLRQDPDVILVGEIRDRETAAIAIQAALTGHLVLSSLHTNDAAGAVGRLLDMGIEPFLVASSLSLVVAQRLVRRNCPCCARPRALWEEERTQLDLPAGEAGMAVRQGAGCARCFGSGYRGRIAVAEVMPVGAALADLITARAPARDIEGRALQEGMRPLREDALCKLREGLTTPAEVIRETAAL